jgi:hypothetical protein
MNLLAELGTHLTGIEHAQPVLRNVARGPAQWEVNG